MHDSRLVRGVLGDLIAMELEPLGAYLSAVDAGLRDVDAQTYRRVALYARRLLRQGASLERVRQCARRSPALLEILESIELAAPAPEVEVLRALLARCEHARPAAPDSAS